MKSPIHRDVLALQLPLWPYLTLARPAYLITAAADVLAGFAVAAPLADIARLPLLVASGVALYAGGSVLNDAFDGERDTREHPRRPIPSGEIDVAHAFFFSAALLAAGVGCALAVNATSGTIALLIALACIGYNSWAQYEPLLGPITLGACRALALLLGLSAMPALVSLHTWLGAVPLVYAAGIAIAGHGEMHGGHRPTLFFALAATLLASLLLLAVAGVRGAGGLQAVPFLVLFALMVVPALVHAYRHPDRDHVHHAMRFGILGLIALDAAIGAAFAGALYAVVILALLPAAFALTRFHNSD